MDCYLEKTEESPLASWGVPLPALWFAFNRGRLGVEELALLRHAFPGTLHVWAVSDGGAGSPAIRAHKRALGCFPTLRRELAVQAEHRVGDEVFFCDIARVGADTLQEVSQLASTTVWGKYSGLLLAPGSIESFPTQLWTLCRLGMDRRACRRSEKEKVLRAYLADVSSTLPLLVAVDSDVNQFLVAPNIERFPEGVLLKRATAPEFASWLSTGLDLRILT